MTEDAVAGDLSVVVASVGRPSVVRTVTSLREAADAAQHPLHVIVAWQGESPPDGLPADVDVVPVLPLGPSAGRNAGLTHVATPLVGFVDDDEVVDVGWVAATLEAFEDPAVDAAFGQVLPLGDGIPYCVLRFDQPRQIRGHGSPPWEVGTGGNMAFRRSVIDRLGQFDVHLGPATPSRTGEDTDLIFRLLEAGGTLAQRPDMIVWHPTKNTHESRTSRRHYGRGMGALARRHRSPRLALQFAVGALWALRAAVSGDRRHRLLELTATIRGWLEGVLLVPEHSAPTTVLARAPADIVAAIGDRRVTGLPVSDDLATGVTYRCGDDLRLDVRPGGPGGAVWELTSASAPRLSRA